MGSKKARERDYARRRYAKQVVRMTKAQRRRRRTQFVGIIAAGTLVIGGSTAAILATRDGSRPPVATETPWEPPAVPAPDPALAEGRTWTGTIELSQDVEPDPVSGTLGIELDGALAPQAVAAFTQLTKDGFFDKVTCHRLTTERLYVLQCGDPDGTGTGGPEFSFGPIENAPPDDIYTVGMLAMARHSNDGWSMGSQFFIVYADSTIESDTAGGYTVFGRVTSGMDLVQRIVANGVLDDGSERPAGTVTMQKVEIQ
ncbi:MAG: peptidylprolyl isomerase [Micrococcales bacterium]|nr:peptidylprolyl isomerase [Micrococcales bacterium]